MADQIKGAVVVTAIVIIMAATLAVSPHRGDLSLKITDLVAKTQR